ncbi:MAG: nucleoside hydrolase [Clostridiales bacterium]|jgi:inosine-uridine nucleoside N-ribohydrolase|nr:nucleoside hydrolase [Clostridiales bacterium]
MKLAQYFQNLEVPKGNIDVVLDTDAYNEIDDQFALAYLLRRGDSLRLQAVYAAPFLNGKSASPGDGMRKSYHEILKVLELADCAAYAKQTFQGSSRFLQNETEAVISAAAEDLAERAMNYSPERPLYVAAIGAATNIASALLLKPEIAENIVIVWLGGHSLAYRDAKEFNMAQDIAAARVVLGSGAPFVLLPCMGVVSALATTKTELEYWLIGKNKLSDYLAKNAIDEAESYAKGKPWSRVLWDVAAVAWLLNGGERFMLSRLIPCPVPTYDGLYAKNADGRLIRYVYHINRDSLFEDLFAAFTR